MSNPVTDGAKAFNGWSCFHCGETFTTEESARQHFGNHDHDIVSCLTKAEAPLMDIIREQQAELMGLRHDNHTEWKAGAYESNQTDFKRFFGSNVNTPHAAFRVYDEMRFERDMAVKQAETHDTYSAAFIDNAIALAESLIVEGLFPPPDSNAFKLLHECKQTKIVKSAEPQS